MKGRVSVATLKRLDKLDGPRITAEALAVYAIALANGANAIARDQRLRLTRAQRTVLNFPRTASIDEWEAVAIASQQRLVEEARDEVIVVEEPQNRSNDNDEHIEACREASARRYGGALEYVREQERRVREITSQRLVAEVKDTDPL